MASASSSTIEYKNENGVSCNCKCPARIVKSWTTDNPGRRFYSCGKGCRGGYGYESSCNFFRWVDVEKPHGWQYYSLLEARDLIRDQKEEIRNLRSVVSEVTREAERLEMKNPSELTDELRLTREECEVLKREVLVLNERSNGLRNVLVSLSIGFVMVIGVMLVMWK